MRWQCYLAIPVLMAVFLGLCSSPLHVSAAPPEAGDRLTVSGVIADAQGKGVKEVEIELLVNGRQFTPQGRDERIETGSKGGLCRPLSAAPGDPAGGRGESPGAATELADSGVGGPQHCGVRD